MNTIESDLFTPLARNTDPATSRQAAASMAPKLAQDRRAAVAAVRQRPGSTARELDAEFAPNRDRAIGKRLPECLKLGLVCVGAVRVCRVSGRHARTWNEVKGGRGC